MLLVISHLPGTIHPNPEALMPFTAWLHAHGETAQYVAFLGLLALFIPLELVVPGRPPGAARRRRFAANFTLTALNVVVLGALPVSFVGAALWARQHGWGFLNLVALPAAAAAA